MTFKMSTMKPLSVLSLVFGLLVLNSVGAQGIGKKLKKKVNKAMDKVEKSVEDVVVGSDEQTEENKEVAAKKMERPEINTSFIDRSNAIFYDDFNGEKATEFPSKWTHVAGNIENGSFEEDGRTDKVVEWISSYATIKPSIKGDEYLGSSFKLEIQVHFNLEGGNQFYNLNLKNSHDPYKNHDIRIANSLIGNGNDNLSRMPGQPPRGWHTIQVSFNKGNLKAFFDGHMLVNNPDIGKHEFTHLEIYASSPGSSGAGYTRSMINHFAIGRAGLPLYERLVTSGRIVVQDVFFDVNKYELKPESYPALNKVLEMLKKHEDVNVTIEGHTDANGSNEDNLILSEKRAEAVKNYLVNNGIKRYRLSIRGFGEEKPVNKGNNEEAWRQNRRVEFVMHE